MYNSKDTLFSKEEVMVEFKHVEEYWHEESTIEEMQQAMEDGVVTAKKLVMYYLHRIATIDKGEPSINSVLEINPDVIQIAEALDVERKETGARGPLHGIPILLKDNIATGDKMPTSAGTLALKNWRASQDAFLVKKLREAGAVILGKSNMTELANAVSTTMWAGYSAVGGQVLNPYGPGEFFVGGSSSGSAVAVSCNLIAASIGTETSQSLLSPAIQNSIVTIKPTFGLVSREGIIPFTYSQDVAGPMTRTVADAAYVLSAIAYEDEKDEATKVLGTKRKPNYVHHLRKDGLKAKRIGVYRNVPADFIESGEHQPDLFEKAIEALKQLGAEVIDSIEIPSIHREWDWNVSRYELKHSINHFLATALPPTGLKDFDELLSYYEKNEQKYGYNKLSDRKSVANHLANSEYIEARLSAILYAQESGIDQVIDENGLDAILFPTYCGADVSARAGYPSIAVPCGYTAEGRPFGITFAGKAFQEADLIEIAYAFEQHTLYRKKPNLG
jgi:amidase